MFRNDKKPAIKSPKVLAGNPVKVEAKGDSDSGTMPTTNTADPRQLMIEELRARCKEIGIHVLPTGHVPPKNAAKILGNTEKTLANQRSKGGEHVIPFYKCPSSGRVFYDLADLADKVYRTKFTSTAQARVARNSKGQK